MGKINSAIKLAEQAATWTKTSCAKSILQTKPPSKINIKGLKLAQLESDTIKISPQKEYFDVIQNMTKQRKNIINTVHEGQPVEFTLSCYKDFYIDVNRNIRSKIMQTLKVEDEYVNLNELIRETNKLDRLVGQSKIPRDITLYRGASPYDFGLDKMNSKDFIQKFYKKGKLFKIPIYPETTLDKTIGENFAKNRILFKINCPKGTSGIYMENLGLPQIGGYGNEEEILLPRNLIYKFKNHTVTDNYDLIELDIINKKPFWKKIHEFYTET